MTLGGVVLKVRCKQIISNQVLINNSKNIKIQHSFNVESVRIVMAWAQCKHDYTPADWKRVKQIIQLRVELYQLNFRYCSTGTAEIWSKIKNSSGPRADFFSTEKLLIKGSNDIRASSRLGSFPFVCKKLYHSKEVSTCSTFRRVTRSSMAKPAHFLQNLYRGKYNAPITFKILAL